MHVKRVGCRSCGSHDSSSWWHTRHTYASCTPTRTMPKRGRGHVPSTRRGTPPLLWDESHMGLAQPFLHAYKPGEVETKIRK